MKELSIEQWGRLLLALSQTSMANFVTAVGPEFAVALAWLAVKALQWEMDGHIPLFGEGDRADALWFAQRLGIDPETAEIRLAPTQEEALAMVCQGIGIDQFLDGLVKEEAPC
ncbi:MAG: hypothetical protein J0I24_09430 [Thiomonas arsenitoxydans]|uniref:Uncharacterized protein n=1 Tax=Thiomonas arsenitoxydans (strain DSM 22701 / CIP 110005 / 3As) TaxID=426114 RepID=A0A8I1SUE0_THIA3|nr:MULTISPECIES: hypothetical protein [Thiomonas]MBN8744515.1 hypothetical protein [Thiomonas arsenitoxydans]ODU96995.1 MAG: hypothetical protein ABT24_06840 [Thiomonas sp. SCN 64-16]